MTDKPTEPVNWGRRASDRSVAAPATITKGTLLPLSLVITLIATTVTATRAWYRTEAQLGEQARQLTNQASSLNSLSEQVRAIAEAQRVMRAEAWTEDEMRDWIEAGRRGGLSLPSLEAAKWTMRLLPEWMRTQDATSKE